MSTAHGQRRQSAPETARRRWGGRGARLTAAALLACAPLTAAGCGGSSGQRRTGANGAPIQRGRDVRALPAAEGAAADAQGALGAHRASARATHGAGARADGAIRATGPQRARHPHGLIDDEVAASAARPLDPCALVGRTEAQRILGAEVQRPVLAPQGPTCIYRVRGGTQRGGAEREVTLVVQVGPPAGRPPQDALRDRMRVRVGGRHAFCGLAGNPTLVIALPGGQVLSVVAPCPIAAAFATRAIAHLASS